jgi:lipopolysaccharide transport system permease protein
MKTLSQIALAPISVWLANASLVRQLTKRQLAKRYRGSVLGIAWSILHPLALLAAYTFVFHFVLDAKWEQLPVDRADGGAAEFAIPLFTGLILFWWTSDCLQAAPLLVLNHANYVKKTVFPLPSLPLPTLLVATLHALISSGVLIVFLLWQDGLSSSFWAYPLVLLSLMPYLLGAMWLLASLGVYLRDLNHLVGLSIMMLMFLTPIFYPISLVPEAFQQILHLNPLTFTVEQARAALLWGDKLDLIGLAQFFALGWLVACVGYALFSHLQKDFADVI